MTQKNAQDTTSPWHPKYWPFWLVYALVNVMIVLPFPLILIAGRVVGFGIMWVGRHRRHVTLRNLELCFPHLSSRERKRLATRSFMATGIGFFEVAMAWWWPNRRVAAKFKLRGLEHVKAGLAKGQGVILISPHITTLDLASRGMSLYTPLSGVYRPNDDPLYDAIIAKGRLRYFEHIIPRKNIREMAKLLKQNKVVGYTPDQDYGPRLSVFAPFFGVEAASITGTSRLARMTGAAVVPAEARRLPGAQGYEIIYHPPITPFPTGDLVQDATLINQVFEAQIKKTPEQYLWSHRRFKSRPPGEVSVYETKRIKAKRISVARYQNMLNTSTIIARTHSGIKVTLSPDGFMVKFFKQKGVFSSELFRSYAFCFADNAKKLIAMGIPSVVVKRIFHVPSEKVYLASYVPLAGKTVSELITSGTWQADDWEKLGAFIAKLHRKGVLFRSLHFGNLVLCPDGDFGLIDVADMRIFPWSLGRNARVRNFKHLTNALPRSENKDLDYLDRSMMMSLLEYYLSVCDCAPKDKKAIRKSVEPMIHTLFANALVTSKAA